MNSARGIFYDREEENGTNEDCPSLIYYPVDE